MDQSTHCGEAAWVLLVWSPIQLNSKLCSFFSTLCLLQDPFSYLPRMPNVSLMQQGDLQSLRLCAAQALELRLLPGVLGWTASCLCANSVGLGGAASEK